MGVLIGLPAAREAVTIKEGEWVCVVARENTTLFVVREPYN